MKKYINRIIVSLILTLAITSCGKNYLDTDYTSGLDMNEALTTVSRIETALTGTYFSFINYRFAGKNVLAISDIASDLSSNNNATTHFSDIFNYTITVNNLYLDQAWEYGYKSVSGAARIIEAAEILMPSATASDQIKLKEMVAQARGIRALSTYYMVNIFSLPYKVDGGADNGSALGVVVVNKPIPAFTQVSRSTVAQTYLAINNDIDQAIELLEEIDKSPDAAYVNTAALYAFRARVALASANYDGAITAANDALEAAKVVLGKTTDLVYTKSGIIALYSTVADNSENIFYAARSATESFTANSIGTLYSTYGLNYNTTYNNLLAETDARKVLTTISAGKYMGIPSGSAYNSEISNIPQFRMPELYLIKAEALLKKAAPDVTAAKEALLVVAKRNSAITSVADLPSTSTELVAFLENERARELFWEGHRFSDLRRWGKVVSVNNGGYINFNIAKFCYPIPANEINAGAGVVQNPNWSSALPTQKP